MNDRRRVARSFGLLGLLLLLAGDVREKNPCCCVMPFWSKGESLLWEGVFLEEAPTERCSQSLTVYQFIKCVRLGLRIDNGGNRGGSRGKTPFLRFY